ncbi:MAG: hypothetical protein B7W95_00680 [Acidimicrobiales bacterium 20-64-4]|nr:MAG: hypothetical protein B7W95_00680 [Acidimicrobiales bacterium 20-64-4]
MACTCRAARPPRRQPRRPLPSRRPPSRPLRTRRPPPPSRRRPRPGADRVATALDPGVVDPAAVRRRRGPVGLRAVLPGGGAQRVAVEPSRQLRVELGPPW